ncbi:hypothetical protein GETHLI_23280 [Geothrix limicola]|uniref:Glycogen debranching enzyme C-terminal domain-containing protein n=1 Tax=Geothrix limicola TaxID=2927978 RepID=A0ABQ5QHL4_9BACT|nr:hypothetical protein [Geothrix limicola]GLH73826.1 hypothetical protein GETHLI_23280 [Geothrix limicola]
MGIDSGPARWRRRVLRALLVVAACVLGAAAPAPSDQLRGIPAAELARRIRANRDLDEVLEMGRDLFKDRFNAGTVYPETWVRDFATFVDVALDRGDRGEIKETLRMFLRFQGADGNIPDGFTPQSEGRSDYQKILSPSAPRHWAHKNTVVTDQESSFILATCTYVRRTGDLTFLDEQVDGQTVRARMLRALDFLLAQRWSRPHGLLWGATTIDWGDVQPEHPWGTFLTKDTHRAIGIYNNAMLALALDSFLPLMGKEAAPRWARVREDLGRAVRTHLWDAKRQKFRPHLYLDGSPFPATFDEDAIFFTGGTVIAIQAGLLEPREAEASFATLRLHAREDGPFTTVGLVCHPAYPAGYFQNPDHQPHIYINGGDWPWISGRVVQAMIAQGFVTDGYAELLPVVQRVKRDKGFFEWYDQAGQPHGAAQFRGAAGVVGLAIKQLQAWAEAQKTKPTANDANSRE